MTQEIENTHKTGKRNKMWETKKGAHERYRDLVRGNIRGILV